MAVPAVAVAAPVVPLANPAVLVPGATVVQVVPRFPGLFDCCQGEQCCYGTFCSPCLFGDNQMMYELLAGVPDSLATHRAAPKALSNPVASCLPGCAAPCATYSIPPYIAQVGVTTIWILLALPINANPANLLSGLWVGAYGGGRRRKIRETFGIPASDNICGSDFCTYFWCYGCATCQESRFLRARLAMTINGAAAGGVGAAPAPAMQMQMQPMVSVPQPMSAPAGYAAPSGYAAPPPVAPQHVVAQPATSGPSTEYVTAKMATS